MKFPEWDRKGPSGWLDGCFDLALKAWLACMLLAGLGVGWWMR